MNTSIFDLFTIGIGPSSSHTVGPMKAAYQFASFLTATASYHIARIEIDVYGSLAFTGKGHGTEAAILLGLEGHLPDVIDPNQVPTLFAQILARNQINIFNKHTITYKHEQDYRYNFKTLLPLHSNGMKFRAYNEKNEAIGEKIYYSIGGGFIIEENACGIESQREVPYPFQSAQELLKQCKDTQLSIAELMLKNEESFRSREEVIEKLFFIADTMFQVIETGCRGEGYLPGGLNVPRRAPGLFQKLINNSSPHPYGDSESFKWLNLYAIAVNEENAAHGRVVTAPTNGAAGIIPAILKYYFTFYGQAKKDDIIKFLLTAGAIGLLYKKRGSISGAEVGCQGEVGVACSMAAAALTAVLGGTLAQIENAAEIGMEHHLGLTCDPINGLVQIPCIERNAMGAIKAFNAAQLALLGDGNHHVSLDKVILTMKQTGKDMLDKYKETSLGGLAVTLTEC